MKTKFLLFSAVLFLLLGLKSKDGVLFLFFAIHLFTLSIGFILLKLEEKRQPKAGIETLPPTESSES